MQFIPRMSLRSCGLLACRRLNPVLWIVEAKPQVWILVIGLAGGHGDSIATAPKLFATQTDCGAAGQAWLAKVDTLPSIDPWDSKWPAKFLCFQTPNN